MKLRTRLSALAAAAIVCAGGLTATLPQTADAAISSEGKEFWLAFDSNYGSKSSALLLYVAGAPGVTGTVEVPGLTLSYPFTIPSSQVAEVTLDKAVMVTKATTQEVTEPKAIHVTASADVTVYGLNQEKETTDAYLGLPVTAVDKRYRILDYQGLAQSDPAYISVVPTAPGTTTFTITPPVALGKTPITRTVDQGDVFQYNMDSTQSWTGTLVEADQPVSVFGGTVCANVPANVKACDHLVEQMMPTSTWGKTFVTFPLATRTNGDTFRVVADEDATTVQIRKSTPETKTLDAGEYYEFMSDEPMEITADKPIGVAQYSNGQTYDQTISDPFMVLISPQEQGSATSVFATPLVTSLTKHFVNITAPTADTAGVTLDGVAVTGWTPIASSTFSAAAVPVSAGAHQVVAPTLAQSIVYGFGNFESYGYPSGGKIAKIATITRVAVDPDRTGKTGDRLCTTATVKDGDGNPVESVNVDVAVTGVVTDSFVGVTDAAGQIEVCQTSTVDGQATVKATHGALSDTATLTWSETPNQEPRLANLSYSQPEGTTVTLDASAATDPEGDPLTYAWDTDDDGAFDDGTGATATLALPLVGTYKFAVQVSDGTSVTTVPGVATATNVVPQPSIVAVGKLDATAKQLSTTGTFTDPGADQWTATVDYGDGTGTQPLTLDQQAKSFVLAHAYGAAGTYAVTVAVKDQAGGSVGIAMVEVVVPGVLPAAGASPWTTPLTELAVLFLVCGGLFVACGTRRASREWANGARRLVRE